jgi:hypothetical protein
MVRTAPATYVKASKTIHARHFGEALMARVYVRAPAVEQVDDDGGRGFDVPRELRLH